MYQKYCIKNASPKFCENLTKIIPKLRLCFEAKIVHVEVKNVHFEVKNISRTCKRRPVFCFVVSQNSKHGQLRNFRTNQKYCVIIKFLFSRKNNSKNWITSSECRALLSILKNSSKEVLQNSFNSIWVNNLLF